MEQFQFVITLMVHNLQWAYGGSFQSWPADSWIPLFILGGVLENKGDFFFFLLHWYLQGWYRKSVVSDTKLICTAFLEQLHLGK